VVGYELGRGGREQAETWEGGRQVGAWWRFSTFEIGHRDGLLAQRLLV
jgi:hypothetical protein